MMNAYERRKKIKDLRQSITKNNRLLTRLLEVDKIITDFGDAYVVCHGYRPKVEVKHGWYLVNGIKYRQAELVTQTQTLYAIQHERTLNNPEEEKHASP